MSRNGTFLDSATTTSVLKSDKALYKWFHVVDQMEYKDQILEFDEKSVFEHLQKNAGSIYIIVPAPHKWDSNKSFRKGNDSTLTSWASSHRVAILYFPSTEQQKHLPKAWYGSNNKNLMLKPTTICSAGYLAQLSISTSLQPGTNAPEEFRSQVLLLCGTDLPQSRDERKTDPTILHVRHHEGMSWMVERTVLHY